jgi:hypothetical protein
MSIVIAIIEGGRDTLQSCLRAVEDSKGEIVLECLVPFDGRVDEIYELSSLFPWVKFIDARHEVDHRRFGSWSREHHDILRAIGLRSASAPIVTLLEDHAAPARGWCTAVLTAHRRSDASVIGGAVENGIDKLLNWAVYYCDFGRYQNPVPEGEVEFASDSNVSYKREALFSVRNKWVSAFHETSVNGELRRRGESVILIPEMVVYQTRRNLRVGSALRERVVWGRSFAGTRSSELSGAKRLVFAIFSSILPFVLTARIVTLSIMKRRYANKVIAALPMILLLQIFWSIGEFLGYVTGKARPGDGSDMQERSIADPAEG